MNMNMNKCDFLNAICLIHQVLSISIYFQKLCSKNSQEIRVVKKIQNFEKIHEWMDKIGFIWKKYGDFFKNVFLSKISH